MVSVERVEKYFLGNISKRLGDATESRQRFGVVSFFRTGRGTEWPFVLVAAVGTKPLEDAGQNLWWDFGYHGSGRLATARYDHLGSGG